MRVVGITMVKDEADVIEGTIRHTLAEGVQSVIVADNLSTDGTREILESLQGEFGDSIWVLDDDDPAHYQGNKMTCLAHLAGEKYGADWIIPFDADELWYAPDRIVGFLDEDFGVTVAPLVNHFCTALDEDDPHPFRRMTWRKRDFNPLGKVAFQWNPATFERIHDGNHGVTINGKDIAASDLTPGEVRVRHFPYRSEDQFVRKARNGARALAATDLPETTGAHWRQYGALLDNYGEECLREVFREHFWFRSPIDSDMMHDPAPFLRW